MTLQPDMPAIWNVLVILQWLCWPSSAESLQTTLGQQGDVTIQPPWFEPEGRAYHWIEIEDQYYGHRNVSYFVSSTGNAIIDGDVVYGTEEQLLANKYDPDSVVSQAFSIRTPWPNAEVKYKYDSDATETLLAGNVPVAISRWLTAAPYLKFTKASPNNNVAQSGVAIISANARDGCHSSIGVSDTPPLTMNLENVVGSSCNCCTNQTTHEVGHLLGMLSPEIATNVVLYSQV